MEISKDMLQAIELAQVGKEEGFNKIYSATYNYVYFRAKSIMKNDEDAWDVVQEVYIVMYKSINKLEKPQNLYAWLRGITYNLAMKKFRNNRDTLLTEDAEGIFDEIQSNDREMQPEDYIEDQVTSNIVKELIEQLPELQKAAVLAYYFDEMNIKTIASQLECSEGTIKSRLNYARQYLKQAVEDKEKKEGIKLHSISIPTIIVAIRLLSKDSAASSEVAQNAYNGICSSLGIGATSISTGTVIDATLGNSLLSGSQTMVTTTATKTSGLIAKFAAATTGVKVAIISTIALTGVISILGVTALHNSLDTEPANSSPTETVLPLATQEVKVEATVTPTVQPDVPIQLSEEELNTLNCIIYGLTDSVEPGYQKGKPLTNDQKMGVAYRILYSLCVTGGNTLGYSEEDIAYQAEDFEFEGDDIISPAYEIPQEDIDLLLTTVLGETISEHKPYEGLMFKDGMYYLHTGISYAGFRDFYKGETTVSYNYRQSRKFDNISLETTEKKAIEEGIREIGYADAEGNETIERSRYKIEFEAVTPGKFGRYSLISYQSEPVDDSTANATNTQQDSSTDVFKLMKEYLPLHVNEVSSQYENYSYSEYFIYDWNSDKKPALIIRDIFVDKSCIYTDYHYQDGNVTLENYGQSIHETLDTVFYKKNDSFVAVTDEVIDDNSESHGAYLYNKLDGEDTKTDEIWFWFRNNGTTQFLDLDSYKKKRAEIESLEKITWYKLDDLTPFEK